jgi:hypothetical protein
MCCVMVQKACVINVSILIYYNRNQHIQPKLFDELKGFGREQQW